MLVASSYAKYISSGAGSDTARVAKWSFKVGNNDIVATDTFEFDLFKTITVQWKWAYEGNDATDVTLGKDGTAKLKVIAKVTATQID